MYVETLTEPVLERDHIVFLHCKIFSESFLHPILYGVLGPVVQSINTLTSSLRGQLVKCFMTL